MWRDILRVLGLTNDARVQISAPGIEVVITGETEQVRSLLVMVKHELEKNAARRSGGKFEIRSDPNIVRPSELDEMDSPYALPEAQDMVRPVREEEDEAEDTASVDRNETRMEDETLDQPHDPVPAARHEVRVTAAESAATKEVQNEERTESTPAYSEGEEAATLLGSDDQSLSDRPAMTGGEDHLEVEHGTKIDSSPPLSAAPIPKPSPEETPVFEAHPRIETTEIAKDPSGPAIVPSSESNPFVTDGGPTLTPSESGSHSQDNADPEVIRDSNISEI